MATQTLADMTDEQLESEHHALMAVRAGIKQKMLDVQQERDRRAEAVALKADMDKLREKHGIDLQVIKPQGIESEEASG